MVTASTIAGLLERGEPQSAAITGLDRRGFTYAELRDQAENTVRILRGLGIARTDRVALVLPNGPELAAAFLGVALAAAAAPLNPGYQQPEFRFYLQDLDAKLLLVQTGLGATAAEVATEFGIPVAEIVPDDKVAGKYQLKAQNASGSLGALDLPQSDDVALILHTSGTTSRPKMVPLSHGNLCASAQHIMTWLSLDSDDRCMNIMPLFHIHGLVAAVLSTLVSGGVVQCTTGFNGLKFFEWLRQLGPTWFTAVPTMHQVIWERGGRGDSRFKNHELRFIRSSSASLPSALMTALGEAFKVPIVESYGMTEAAHQMTSNPLSPGRQKPGTVGLPAGPRVEIMDDGGRILEQGKTGEVVIRGPNVTAGYLNNPDANASAFVNGWFRTGDQGSFTSDGHLRLTGRLKELINRGGEKISPYEVEEVLGSHPAVAEVVAFSIPHRGLGEDVAAAVVLRESMSATDEEVLRCAREKLAPFKVPRKIIFMDVLPRGPTGKLQRIGFAKRVGLT